ncbi:hypothetical protein acdb102_26820 [Acidothermaceae bacterium B102]|nr:hypothetical protein acdb102_26820 [Acidothermaceae bacterium B102]
MEAAAFDGLILIFRVLFGAKKSRHGTSLLAAKRQKTLETQGNQIGSSYVLVHEAQSMQASRTFASRESLLLTSTPSRSHRSKARSVAISLVVIIVLAVLAGAGYAVSRHTGTPSSAPSSTVPTTTAAATTSAPPSTPASAAAGAIPFVALPIGSPPTAGTGDMHYSWYHLSATLSGPRSVTVGSTAQFTLRLTNATSAAITLTPCPAYDLTVGYQTTSYGLNCAGAATDVIAPGASVSFALPVPISHSLATGVSTDVSWSLGWQPDKHSPTAHQAVRVSG